MGKQRALAVLLILAAGRLRAAEEAIPQADVDCEERQLGRLVHRAAADLLESNLFLWRSSASGGVYRGLLAGGTMISPTDRTPFRQEEQLAFDLVIKTEEDFLSPRRPRLPQATLVLRRSDSNLHPPGVYPLSVTIDIAPEVSDPTTPMQPVEITNLLVAGDNASDRAARSIEDDDFVSPCHSHISQFDLKMFSILSRTVRASSCLSSPFLGCIAWQTRFKAVIFRDAEPLTYRMNIMSYGVGCGNSCAYYEEKIALLFRMTTDGAERLTGGRVQVLDWCTTPDQISCSDRSPSVAVFVMPPLVPGLDRQGPAVFKRSSRLNIAGVDLPEYNVLAATIDWSDLLSNSAWNLGGR